MNGENQIPSCRKCGRWLVRTSEKDKWKCTPCFATYAISSLGKAMGRVLPQGGSSTAPPLIKRTKPGKKGKRKDSKKDKRQ